MVAFLPITTSKKPGPVGKVPFRVRAIGNAACLCRVSVAVHTTTTTQEPMRFPYAMFGIMIPMDR
jgi:hypothetical protein